MSELLSALQRAAKRFPGGIEALAAALSTPDHRLNPQVLRNQLSGNPGHFLSLARAEEIIDLCHTDELAHAAARQRGGVFVKVPVSDKPSGDMAVLEMITQLWEANGDVGRAVHKTLADGRVDHHEIREVRLAVYRVQSSLIEMLRRLEDMAG